MFRSVIMITTAVSVALHAMLGCCVHHTHGCQGQHGGKTPAALCHHGDHFHASHNHSTDDPAPKPCDQQDSCDEGDCSFTSVSRSVDLEHWLTLASRIHVVCDGSIAETMAIAANRLDRLEVPLDPLALSGDARAVTQVWRL